MEKCIECGWENDNDMKNCEKCGALLVEKRYSVDNRRFEYKFVKLNTFLFENSQYHEVIDEHVKQGWRLVQIFAPSSGMHGTPNFCEIIFEKNLER